MLDQRVVEDVEVTVEAIDRVCDTCGIKGLHYLNGWLIPETTEEEYKKKFEKFLASFYITCGTCHNTYIIDGTIELKKVRK